MYPCTLTNAYVKQPVYQKHMVSGRFSAFLLTVFSLISEVINSHFFYDADPLRSLFFGDFCTIEVSEIHWKGATHMTADKLIIQQKKQIDELTAQLHSLQMSFDILSKTY